MRTGTATGIRLYLRRIHATGASGEHVSNITARRHWRPLTTVPHPDRKAGVTLRRLLRRCWYVFQPKFEHVALVGCLHAPRADKRSGLAEPQQTMFLSFGASCRWHPGSCEQLHSNPFLINCWHLSLCC
ncbi:hypothetical protein MRX96_001347 [Rhipicephalus microplus]